MNKYDVYWARYAFEDNPTIFKVRPVVILDPTSILILVIKVTSKPLRKIIMIMNLLIGQLLG